MSPFRRKMLGAVLLGPSLFLASPSASAQTITQIIDSTGSGVPLETLDSPTGVAVDAAGNVYVAAFASNSVFKITPAGAITQIIDATGSGVLGETLAGSFGIAVDAAGNVYVAGNGSSNVFKIEPGGTITQIIDSSGDGGGNVLTNPSGVVLDADGNVYVVGENSDNAFKIEPTGTITEIIDATGDGGGNALTDPVGIAADASGNIYITGSLSDNAFKIEPGGAITQIIDADPVGPGTLQYPAAVTVDAAGNVYVGGQFSNNAFRIEPGGAITEIITSSGDGSGNWLDGPSAIAVDAWGNIYIAAWLSHNVFRIRPDGLVVEILDATGDGLGNVFFRASQHGVAVDDSGTVYASGFQSDNAFRIEPRYYVDANAVGTGDGSSWADAYTDLQPAMAAAAVDPNVWQIWVAGVGPYYADNTCGGGCTAGSGQRNASFVLQSDLALFGSFAGTESMLTDRSFALATTALSGDLNVDDADTSCPNGDGDCTGQGDRCINGVCAVQEQVDENSYHVVRADGPSVDDTAILNGFRITGGNASDATSPGSAGGGMIVTNGAWPRIERCFFTGNVAAEFGGALRMDFGSGPTISNCTFALNTAQWGGAINSFGSVDVLSDCVFSHNTATQLGGAFLSFEDVQLELTRCDFDNNRCTWDGGALFVERPSVKVTIDNCDFKYNQALDDGGAIRFFDTNLGAQPLISNCGFNGNQASGGGDGFNGGGAIFSWFSSPTIRECSFENNVAGNLVGGNRINGGSGAILNENASDSKILNCSFVGNQAQFGGAVQDLDFSSSTLINSTFVGNIASGDGGGFLSFLSSNSTFVNCAFLGNISNGVGSQGPFGGGGIAVQSSSSATLKNCTVAFNLATSTGTDDGGGGIHLIDSTATLTNSILWGNTAPNNALPQDEQIFPTGTSSFSVNYTTIEGWTGLLGGTGNNGGLPTDDPDFVSAFDLHLAAGSPAIDFADNTALPNDIYDVDLDGDITERLPTDAAFNPRFLDDPLTSPDQGVDGPPFRRVDRGAYEHFVDCDFSGIPELCDLDCSDLENNCSNYANCGIALNCNGDSQVDACEISDCSAVAEDCGGDVVCDDCNIDLTMDGCVLPANCICAITGPLTTASVSAALDWSDGASWIGGIPPNNAGATTQSVTIAEPTANMIADIDITVDTTRVMLGATLSVNGEFAGDLTLVESGGLLIEGNLRVGFDRQIDVSLGQTVVGPNGVYEKDPLASTAVSATLTTGSLTVEPGSIAGGTLGGKVTLDDTMNLIVDGDLVLRGTTEAAGPASITQALGITPLSKVRVFADSVTSVGQNLILEGDAELTIDSTDAQESPGARIVLSGDFINQSTLPTAFDMTTGLMILNGSTEQTFETAGEDLSASPAGFGTAPDTNFSIDRLEIADNAIVRFTNEIPNVTTLGACTEALYVRTLTLGAGSTVTLENTKVYWETLIDNGAIVEANDCAGLQQICPQAQPPATPIDGVLKNRFVSFADGDPGLQTAIRFELRNLPGNFATWNGTVMWVQEPDAVSENSGVSGSSPPDFAAATLGCTPYYADWSALGTIHVYHEGIVPEGEYILQAVESTCNASFEPSFSTPFTVTNTKWADLAGPFDSEAGRYSAPDGSVSVPFDVVAILDKFRNLPAAPLKSRADLEPGVPNMVINVQDTTSALDAFSGAIYPFSPVGPAPCGP